MSGASLISGNAGDQYQYFITTLYSIQIFLIKIKTKNCFVNNLKKIHKIVYLKIITYI